MILLWGVSEDPPLNAVRCALERRGEPYYFLDQRDSLPEYAFRFGASVAGEINSLRLENVAAAYIRPFDYAQLPEHAEADDSAERLRLLARFTSHLSTWLEVTPALVVTRFSAQASNTSKLYQLARIQKHFAVPSSIATTDADAVHEFQREQGRLVYKSLSSVRSIVSQLTDEPFRFGNLRHCPTLFQQYVQGTDYRVHVVGDRVFATMLWSESDDYRYDRSTERVSVEIPDSVTGRCVRLSKSLHLPLAGIDLRRASDGRWFCFEVNPSPGFSYYERGESREITEAVADLLLRGTIQRGEHTRHRHCHQAALHYAG